MYFENIRLLFINLLQYLMKNISFIKLNLILYNSMGDNRMQQCNSRIIVIYYILKEVIMDLFYYI